MNRDPAEATLPPAQLVAEKVFNALERFLRVEALSGVVLLITAAAALLWANSPVAETYHHLWETPVALTLGSLSISNSLHFVINDVLMTVFFLVVGMEIRREMHEGALSQLRVAALPLAAALGGVVVPALIYFSLNTEPSLRHGWAIPTATDIAFAVGVLALLGKSIPVSIRIFLLALAIIDDIAAVIIIALFYSGGLDYSGLLIVGVGVLLILGFQSIGIGNAFAYVLPGAILWFGILKTGAHPTLAGVVLGFMTPVVPLRMRMRPVEAAANAVGQIGERIQNRTNDAHQLIGTLKQLRLAEREILPPVVRVQAALHPWVAFGIMPLFALANAGVQLDGVDTTGGASRSVMLGVAIALVIGKPIGIVLGSWSAIRLGWCKLPNGVTWRGVWLIGLLGGIGFTMSVFIANLAFRDPELLGAAKLGVLLASVTAAILGLTFGRLYVKSEQLRLMPKAT